MEIQRQELSNKAILSYSAEQLVIGNETYRQSLLLSAQEIICPWGPLSGHDLTLEYWQTLDLTGLEVIIVGYHLGTLNIPSDVRGFLIEKNIGLESMNLGAACRTFNVLLSEQRKVLGVFRLSTNDKK
jgi:uncharacterized protein